MFINSSQTFEKSPRQKFRNNKIQKAQLEFQEQISNFEKDLEVRQKVEDLLSLKLRFLDYFLVWVPSKFYSNNRTRLFSQVVVL